MRRMERQMDRQTDRWTNTARCRDASPWLKIVKASDSLVRESFCAVHSVSKRIPFNVSFFSFTYFLKNRWQIVCHSVTMVSIPLPPPTPTQSRLRRISLSYIHICLELILKPTDVGIFTFIPYETSAPHISLIKSHSVCRLVCLSQMVIDRSNSIVESWLYYFNNQQGTGQDSAKGNFTWAWPDVTDPPPSVLMEV